MVRIAALVAVSSLAPGVAAAQAVQPWPSLSITVPLAPKWRVSGEAVGRIATAQRPSQLETRLQVSRALSPKVSVGGGWAHLNTFVPGARNTFENQAVEQLNWGVGSIGRVSFATRTRLEQRFISGSETSWRLREQVHGALALGGKQQPSLVLWTEPYFALNRTRAQRRTLDQLRTFVGVGVPLSRSTGIELGYLNQRLYRPAGTIMNHAIPLTLSCHF